MAIKDILKTLTRNEITVLFWKCRGLQYKQISMQQRKSIQWVQGHMTGVYEKFGINKNVHSTDRMEFLEKNVCPEVSKLTEKQIMDWPKNGYQPDGSPVLEVDVYKIEERKAPIVDEKVLAMVIYDEKENEEPDKEPPIIVIPQQYLLPPPKPNPLVVILRRVIFLILVIGAISTVGYFAYTFGRGSNSPQVIIITATPAPVTDTALPFQTIEFVVVVVPSDTISPTLTPIPTETPFPTETSTPKPYFDELERVIIDNGFSLMLSDNFGKDNGRCDMGFSQFIINLELVNSSSGQFLLRFISDGFQATDDLGNSYKIQGSGFGPASLQEYQQDYMFNTGESDELCLNFSGQLPLGAKYLLITVDNFSGYGPFVFKKIIH